MNYADLCTALQNTVEYEFSATDLANFFKQAEQNIYQSVQLPNLRKNMTGLVSTGTPYVQAPADMMSLYSVAIVDESGDYHFLLPKDVNYIREAYPSQSATSFPQVYALFGASPSDASKLVFMLGPTPDAGYTIEIHYFYQPESIVTAGTTWLGDNYHTVLLNGALVEAARFQKSDPDVVKMYLDMYAQSLTLLKTLGDGKFRSDTYRSGQTTIPVR